MSGGRLSKRLQHLPVQEPDEADESDDVEVADGSDAAEEVPSITLRDIIARSGQLPRFDLGVRDAAINAFIRSGVPSMLGASDVIRAINDQTLAHFKNVQQFSAWQKSSLAGWLPLLQANSALQSHVIAINADMLKAAKLPQLQLGLLSNQLAKNADFGLGEGFDQIARQFAATQNTWWSNLAPLIAGFKVRAYPGNLNAIEELKLDEVQAVVMLDGIALYGVPRTAIAKAILRAEDSAKRRRIIGRHWEKIVDDCRAVLATCKAPALAAEVRHTTAAIKALEAGHTQASQALVGSVIDSLVSGYFGDHRYDFTPNSKTKNSDAYNSMRLRQYIALAPVWKAYQQFRVGKGDRVPVSFSRHATAHTVSGRQYSRVNAVQALMIACGILLFLEEEEAKQQAA